MQMLFTFIGSHLLTILENLLIQNEAAIVNQVQNEAKLLISKIESILQAKSPAAATILNPVLNLTSNLTNDAIVAVGNSLVKDIAQN